MTPALDALIRSTLIPGQTVDDMLRAAKVSTTAPRRWATRGQIPSRAALDRLAEVTGLEPRRILEAVAADAGAVDHEIPCPPPSPAPEMFEAAWAATSPQRVQVRRVPAAEPKSSAAVRGGAVAAVLAVAPERGDAVRAVSAILEGASVAGLVESVGANLAAAARITDVDLGGDVAAQLSGSRDG